MIRYFVSYHYTNYRGAGFGWAEVTLTAPMRGRQDVSIATKSLKDSNPDIGSVVILGWQRFED